MGRGAASDVGAPVFTLEGRLAGVLTSSDGEPVLVPADVVMRSVDRLLREGPPPPGDIGVVTQAVEFREQHRVARYLEQLEAAYHGWYDRTRVTPLGDEQVTDLHRTRLWLNDAPGQVLRNGLALLGVSAPERM